MIISPGCLIALTSLMHGNAPGLPPAASTYGRDTRRKWADRVEANFGQSNIQVFATMQWAASKLRLLHKIFLFMTRTAVRHGQPQNQA